MAAVTVWLPLLFLVLIPKQSNEDSGQFSEREFQNLDVGTIINRTRDLKQQNETFYSKCEELREMKKQIRATMFGHTKLLEALLPPFHTGCRRLLDAAESGDVNSAKLWVKYGNDSCVRGGYYTALMLAALSGHVEVVRVLLEGGANIEATGNSGSTALMEAARNGKLDVCRLLLDRGAKVNAVDSYRYTALYWAALRGHVEVVRVLLEGGANVERTGDDGKNALMVAARIGKLDVCRLLLDRGAKVNAVDNDGNTALLLAAIYGHLSVVKLLVERGADVTVKDKDGFTAIDGARLFGRTDVLQWLGSVSEG